jgi:hypothetical protein
MPRLSPAAPSSVSRAHARALRSSSLSRLSVSAIRRGEPLALPTPGKNVRVGVVGAVRYPTEDFRFAHQLKSVTTVLFLAVLEMLVKRVKHDEAVRLLCRVRRLGGLPIRAATPERN